MACLFALGACQATALPESTGDVHSASTQADWSDFNLGPNDLLHLSVFGHPEFVSPDGGLRVAPNGTLSVALLGDVDVTGKSVSEARQTIEAGLSRYYANPSVTLSVLTYASRRFFVLGDVVQPGPVSMDRPLSALEALSMGAGFKPGANRERVVILRQHPEDEIEVIEFNAATPGVDGLVQVRPNDLLFVGSAGVGVFSEKVLPYLQGMGLTIGQTTSLVLAFDRL